MRLFSRRQRRRWETEVETVFGGRRNGVDVALARARAREFNPRPRARCAQTSFQRAFFFERRNANYRSGMRYDCFCNTVPVTQVQAAADSSLGFPFRQLNRNSCSHFRPPFRPFNLFFFPSLKSNSFLYLSYLTLPFEFQIISTNHY